MSETVHILTHLHRLDRDETDVKFLGVFNDDHAASTAIGILGAQPGFSSSTEGFVVRQLRLNLLDDSALTTLAAVAHENTTEADPASTLSP